MVSPIPRVHLPSGNTDHFTPESYPSSAAFDAINDALSSNEADRQDAIKQAKSIFAFVLKNDAGQEQTWHIDLKDTGKVIKGAPKKADVTLSLSDADFGKMVSGKTKAQSLFMSGKLKIKGNVMKGKFGSVLTLMNAL